MVWEVETELNLVGYACLASQLLGAPKAGLQFKGNPGSLERHCLQIKYS